MRGDVGSSVPVAEGGGFPGDGIGARGGDGNEVEVWVVEDEGAQLVEGGEGALLDVREGWWCVEGSEHGVGWFLVARPWGPVRWVVPVARSVLRARVLCLANSAASPLSGPMESALVRPA